MCRKSMVMTLTPSIATPARMVATSASWGGHPLGETGSVSQT